jgi:hypothetical protein
MIVVLLHVADGVPAASCNYSFCSSLPRVLYGLALLRCALRTANLVLSFARLYYRAILFPLRFWLVFFTTGNVMRYVAAQKTGPSRRSQVRRRSWRSFLLRRFSVRCSVCSVWYCSGVAQDVRTSAGGGSHISRSHSRLLGRCAPYAAVRLNGVPCWTTFCWRRVRRLSTVVSLRVL